MNLGLDMKPAHPTPVFLAFFIGAIAATVFHPFDAAWVLVMVLALATTPRDWPAALRRTGAQWWRMKWLLLATLVFMALPTPGAPLAEGLPEFLPSREGLHLALGQTLRVMTIIFLYASLPGALTLSQRLLGLQDILRHFGSTGQRFGRRLALTLHELETLRGRNTWELLRESSAPAATSLPSHGSPPLAAMSPADRRRCLILLGGFGVGGTLTLWR